MRSVISMKKQVGTIQVGKIIEKDSRKRRSKKTNVFQDTEECWWLNVTSHQVSM